MDAATAEVMVGVEDMVAISVGAEGGKSVGAVITVRLDRPERDGVDTRPRFGGAFS